MGWPPPKGCPRTWRAPGLTIVSGMARGIDTTAHKGALSADGDTVAVLGCGVDVIYPSENRKLAADLSAKGLILSEFAMGSTAFPQNFPIRNRIISGMSAGVLVVEGAQYSGSAITAKLALDQGREVFAVPGNITSKASWGPNLLIKQGAKLVQDWNDVIVELPAEVRRQLIERSRTRLLGNAGASQDGGQASLLEGKVRGISTRSWPQAACRPASGYRHTFGRSASDCGRYVGFRADRRAF